MHSLTYVFIPNTNDIDEAVAVALEPFSEEAPVKPWRRYLDDGEIAAMAKCYGLRKRSLQTLARKMEDWCGCIGGVEGRRLYAVSTSNPDGKWDWYEIGGRWDGVLRGNVAIAATLLRSPCLQEKLPHDFLTPDGVWHARERFEQQGWLNGRWIKKRDGRWLEEFTAALRVFASYRVVAVDRHS
jgi:hypothetical protein